LKTINYYIINMKKEILFFGTLLLLISCDSNTTIKKEVLTNISRYEISTIELVNQFDTLAKFYHLSDTGIHSIEIFSRCCIRLE
ncbi:hypothetical protein, partial [Rhizobium leguminosarum]|uniref:hypothetical protein n=1 Tax=Rhizobium leguminosarum TaxID=384 RepID=UPI003F979B1F